MEPPDFTHPRHSKTILGDGTGLTLSMGLYSVYVLLFAVAAQLCDRRNESNGACVVGNTYQLPVNLAGAVSYSGDREPK